MKQIQRIYGDETLCYSILARDMTPESASEYIEQNIKDYLIKKMPHGRLLALIRRAKEDLN